MSAKANLLIVQGTDFTTSLTVNDSGGSPVNLTGYLVLVKSLSLITQIQRQPLH